MTDGMLPMRQLAPIVDRLRKLAHEEIPAPRTCRVRLWDDGTYSAYITHSGTGGEAQLLRYERTTSEIVYEDIVGTSVEVTVFPDGEELRESHPEPREVRVIETVEPPMQSDDASGGTAT